MAHTGLAAERLAFQRFGGRSPAVHTVTRRETLLRVGFRAASSGSPCPDSRTAGYRGHFREVGKDVAGIQGAVNPVITRWVYA